MELGPIQKAWVQSLREHPERQMRYVLGKGTPDNYTACCLGELHIIGCKMLNKPLLFETQLHIKDCIPIQVELDEKDLILQDEDEGDAGILRTSYNYYGLHSPRGEIKFGNDYKEDERLPKTKDGGFRPMFSLAEMNDNDYTWAEIADYIEKYPEAIFTKSV